MQEIIKKYIPNWLEYKKIFPKNTKNIKFMETSFESLYEIWKLEEIGKRINVDLWICNLNKKEIDEKLKKLFDNIFHFVK